jgi:hypothetical protein
MMTVTRQPVGNGPPDSARRAGDQNNLSFSLNF